MFEHTEPTRTFRIKWSMRLLFLFASAMGAFVMYGIAQRQLNMFADGTFHPIDFIASMFFFIMFIPFALAAPLLILGQRLVISPAGLSYHILASDLYARWDQVVAIDTLPYGYVGDTDSILVHRPHIVPREWARRLNWKIEVPSDDEAQIVPVSQFMERWHDRELGRLIHQYMGIEHVAEPQ